ncbi:MAG: substrate-binding domain-containing protein, partial [Planctomycetota bacterium]
ALDAAVVYRSNAQPFADSDLCVIPIEHAAATATQPFAVARSSQYPATMERLMEAVLSKRSRESFERLGFRWVANQDN